MKNSPGGNPVMQNRSKFYHRFKLPLSLLALFFLFLAACQREDTVLPERDIVSPDQELDARSWHSPDMVLAWNQAIETMFTFPTNALSKGQPVTARIFAMYHLAIHDALNCITPKYDRYVGVPRDKDASTTRKTAIFQRRDLRLLHNAILRVHHHAICLKLRVWILRL